MSFFCFLFFLPRHHAQVHLAQMKDKQKVTGFVSPLAMLLGGGFKYDILYVHPGSLGKMFTQFDDHMFQMGWFNHQLYGVPQKVECSEHSTG